MERCALRCAHIVTYHCYRRVELRWPIRLDDRQLHLRFTIALSVFFGKRMCEKQRDAESAMCEKRRKQSQVGEEKSSCKARLCSDPTLDGMFHAEFGRFPFLRNRHLSLPSLLKLSLLLASPWSCHDYSSTTENGRPQYSPENGALSLLSAMGQHEHHWRCRQLRLGQDVACSGYHQANESALGCHPVNGSFVWPLSVASLYQLLPGFVLSTPHSGSDRSCAQERVRF
jgi:hypothetical protein